MKTFHFFFMLIPMLLFPQIEDCSELFISEILIKNPFNPNTQLASSLSGPQAKMNFIEIYNPSEESKDLSDYSLVLIDESNVESEYFFSGSVFPNEAIVLSNVVDTNNALFDLGNVVNDLIQMDGNVKIEWRKNSNVIDRFGKTGVLDPYTIDVDSILSNPIIFNTEEIDLRSISNIGVKRRSHVSAGRNNTFSNEEFLQEWEVNLNSTTTGLGVHNSISCFSTSSGIVTPLCHYENVNVYPFEHATETNPWVLEWSDEFNGDSLNLQNWNRPQQAGEPFGNKVDQLYTYNNCEVSNGTLKMWIREADTFAFSSFPNPNDSFALQPDGKPNYRHFEYTSASLWSVDSYVRGAYEAMVKIPSGNGMWPAFWLWQVGLNEYEIDIFEFWETDGQVPVKISGNEFFHWSNPFDDNVNTFGNSKNRKRWHTTIHNWQYTPINCPTDEPTHFWCHEVFDGLGDFSSTFHLFRLEWDQGKIVYLLDGNVVRVDYAVYRQANGAPVTTSWGPNLPLNVIENEPHLANAVFPKKDQYFNIVLNVAVQAEILESEYPNETFPKSMEIDYVRYYKRNPFTQKLSNTNTDFVELIVEDGVNTFSWGSVENRFTFKLISIASGQVINENKKLEFYPLLDFSSIPPGPYVLTIRDEGDVIHNYKILLQ